LARLGIGYGYGYKRLKAVAAATLVVIEWKAIVLFRADDSAMVWSLLQV
jgi:hypothetical protein